MKRPSVTNDAPVEIEPEPKKKYSRAQESVERGITSLELAFVLSNLSIPWLMVRKNLCKYYLTGLWVSSWKNLVGIENLWCQTLIMVSLCDTEANNKSSGENWTWQGSSSIPLLQTNSQETSVKGNNVKSMTVGYTRQILFHQNSQCLEEHSCSILPPHLLPLKHAEVNLRNQNASSYRGSNTWQLTSYLCKQEYIH